MAQQEFVIITGLSGAGKSVAMKCFEDLGYFCVDNLPPVFIPKLAQLCATSSNPKLAIVIDVRGREFFSELQEALNILPEMGFEPKILFLEASESVLVRRYAETRRRHPLGKNKGVLQGIRQEKKELRVLRSMADRILDTSTLSPHQLMRKIQDIFSSTGQEQISIHLVSFGFKYGLPTDADIVIDVRFLPNPHYVTELQPLTGLDDQVQRFVNERPATEEFLTRLKGLLDFILPRYFDEGKQQLTVGIGCTGGKHRSIAITERLARDFRNAGHTVSVHHRDLERSQTEEAVVPQ